MFDISWSELLLISVVALVFIGPKELPGVLRTVGQWTGKIRRMAGEFQDQFREAMREAEMADLKKEVDEATGKLGAGLDPFADIKEAVEWKPPESPAASVPPAADAPPAPPAEAIVAEPAPAVTVAAQPAGEPAVPASGPAPAAPGGGDRAA
jgi:sec-independent protein translocase protein TatB